MQLHSTSVRDKQKDWFQMHEHFFLLRQGTICCRCASDLRERFGCVRVALRLARRATSAALKKRLEISDCMITKNRFLQFTFRTPANAFLSVLALLLAFGNVMTTFGRDWRVGQIPNGDVNRCANCHTSSLGGGPRNAFGQDVEQRVGPFSQDPFWDATLAAIDSDGDTFSNGAELGDPDGDGIATPGVQVFNPGNAASRPASPRPPVVNITAPA